MRNWQHMFVVVVSASVSSECGDMYNNQEQNKAPPMSPRISFSNDFVESSSRFRYRDAPVSSDFEFSVTNYSMMSADELFSKGRLLPLKEGKTTTLRDELQNDDDDEDEDDQDQDQDRQRPPKNPTRWRGFLGLRKSHIPSKKLTHTSIDKRASSFHHHDHTSQSQEFGD